jgi:hypothetical protein
LIEVSAGHNQLAFIQALLAFAMPVEPHILQVLSSTDAQDIQHRHSSNAYLVSSPLLVEGESINDEYTLNNVSGGRRSSTKSEDNIIRRSSIIIDESIVPDMWSR